MQNQNLLPVSKEEWVLWKNSKVTQRFVYAIAQQRRGMMEEWADGRCQSESHEQVIKGRIQQIRDILDYALETFDFIEEENG